ncbi:MAG: ADOP family duplicated permease [Gemmatimonadota bacterium]
MSIIDSLRALVGRRRLDNDFADELADHVERDTAWRVAQGTDPAEARRAAVASLGGLSATQEQLRETHGITALMGAWRDVAYAWRRTRRSPGYSILVAATLALGIGAATAVFSALDGVLLKSLPFRDPGELTTIWQTKPSVGVEREDVPPRTFLDWTEQARSFALIAAGNPWSINLRSRDRTENIEAWQVSPDFFTMLDVSPALGRSFRAEDFLQQGGAPVALLDHAFWESRFGSDPAIIGSSLTLDDRPHLVIGVMPRGFELPSRTSVWLPWVPDSAQRNDRFGTYIRVFARLRPDVDVSGAQAELTAVATRLEREYPRSNNGVGALVVPLHADMIRGYAPLLWTLLAASLLLLAVAIANVTALHLTRIARLRGEAAVRSALGGSPLRVARPFIAEAVLLSVVGGLAGLAVGWSGIRVIHHFGPIDLPRLADISLDLRAVGLAMLLALLSGSLVALLTVRRLHLVAGIASLGSRVTGGDRGTLRARRVAVITQLALALVLLVGTSLLVRSFVAVLTADRGYQTGNLISFTTWVFGEYPRPADRERFVERVFEQLGMLPGVNSVTVASALPLADQITGESADIRMEGAVVEEGEEPQARGVVVWPTYFTTLGIGLRRGRGLVESDDENGELVVVVNEAFARRFSPGRDAVGRLVDVGLMGRARPRRIVGVVADVRHARLDAPPDPAVYIPWQQQPLAALTFVVRTGGDAGALAPAIQRIMFEIDARVGLARVATLEQLVQSHVRDRRFLLVLLGGFAAVAVLLACVGVAGVMAQTVSSRTREIAVRMALGASTADVRSELLREAGRMALIGTVVGLAVALASTRALQAFLFGVSPLDAIAWVGAVLLMVIVSLAAALPPSMRATRVQPARVLQDG